MKVDEFSFMEVIKELDSGSLITFEELEAAVEKAQDSANVAPYLLKPLVERYKRVKGWVELVRGQILSKKQSSSEVEEAVSHLRE
jgi:hypothetical protein